MFPLLSALAQAGGIIVDKIILTRRRVNLHVFIPALFLFLFITTAVMFPFLGNLRSDLFTPYYLTIFFLMILTAIIWNVFYYRGVQAEKVHDFELIIMSQPLFTILLASVFLKNEQNFYLVLAAIVASAALIIANIKKEHFVISTASVGLILAIILMSVELIFIDILLKVMSPVALYAIRTGIIFLFFIFYYRPHLKHVSDQNLWWIFLTSVLGTVQMVAKFYGFQKFGVIYTSLILILAPILTYAISTIFLHEKLKLKTTICALVILACIVYATFIGK